MLGYYSLPHPTRNGHSRLHVGSFLNKEIREQTNTGFEFEEPCHLNGGMIARKASGPQPANKARAHIFPPTTSSVNVTSHDRKYLQMKSREFMQESGSFLPFWANAEKFRLISAYVTFLPQKEGPKTCTPVTPLSRGVPYRADSIQTKVLTCRV